jgi:hypothetical protein
MKGGREKMRKDREDEEKKRRREWREGSGGRFTKGLRLDFITSSF